MGEASGHATVVFVLRPRTLASLTTVPLASLVALPLAALIALPLAALIALPLAALIALPLAATGCHEDPPLVRHEPMRTPASGPASSAESRVAAASVGAAASEAELEGEQTEAPPPLAERPLADPAITKAIDLIGASGLRFIDQAADEDSKPSEYTAEQFAGMLRSKWEWIGYDICELDAWIEEIATRSFFSHVARVIVMLGLPSRKIICEVGMPRALA